MIKRYFVEHPETVGETYLEHLQASSGFGFRMVLGGVACLLHGLLPFLFVRTGSAAVTELHDRMVANRVRKPTPKQEVGGQERGGAFENA
ncbi:DUF6356 family protein [Alteriqipengyuania lutimaris]|uniref:Capsule biosynthesis protein n=1 Tax=Alteriqipengyuania lutimaris TaxID=1538146 RepID=A0A395LI04_9SPHN|nr:DUF6356 family protein [Alteriqipengyuania lutimaris]MBB3034873.1 hypothetical protein [Alteriqipengyuania lutimaris]RDS76295.1 hypothetical protein DL238_00795 [Alteriqipengyuania lutimaris]